MNDLPILRSTAQLRSRLRSWRAFGETVALVPVDGVLHEGHAAVIRAAAREADRVLVSARPSDPEGEKEGEKMDEAQLAAFADEARADALHLPQPEELRPADAATRLSLPGMTDVLCGEDRPEALADFALVMTRLFNQSQAETAMFGERDWQRLAIMRRAAADLGLPTLVKAAPTERDDDGVAYAAGAQALEGDDRQAAIRLWRELSRAAAAIDAGAEADPVLDAAADALADAGAEVEYLEMRDAHTLAEVSVPEPGRPARIFACIGVGGLKLIDNVPVGDEAAL